MLNIQSLYLFILHIKNLVLFPTLMCVGKENILQFSLLIPHFRTDTHLLIYDICI